MKKGFTLIELLVVITIIGILSVIGVNSYVIANQKARNSRRVADVQQIRSALEMYRTDNGSYPVAASWVSLIRSYMSGRDAVDPKGGTYTYDYVCTGVGCSGYSITYYEEPAHTAQVYLNP